MDISAILCNYAEATNNLLYIVGGGINQVQVPAGAPGPYGVNVCVGLTVFVPWEQTDAEHELTLTLLDDAGAGVGMPTGPGGELVPFELAAKFSVGRSPASIAGDPQPLAMAFNLPGMPLPRVDGYWFVLAVDGVVLQRLPLRVAVVPAAAPAPVLSGAAAAGRLGA